MDGLEVRAGFIFPSATGSGDHSPFSLPHPRPP